MFNNLPRTHRAKSSTQKMPQTHRAKSSTHKVPQTHRAKSSTYKKVPQTHRAKSTTHKEVPQTHRNVMLSRCIISFLKTKENSQDVLFINKGISNRCFKTDTMIVLTHCRPSRKDTGSPRDLVTPETTGGRLWPQPYLPVFYTDSWVVWWDDNSRVPVIFSMFRDGSHNCLKSTGQNAAKFQT